MITAVVAVVAVAAGAAIALALRKVLVSNRLQDAEARAAKLVADAEREAEGKVRQALLEVKQEMITRTPSDPRFIGASTWMSRIASSLNLAGMRRFTRSTSVSAIRAGSARSRK